MDVCVITYKNGPERAAAGLRPHDRLWVRDNTFDNIGFARAANELAAKGSDRLILFVNPDGDPLPGCFDALERMLEDSSVVATAARTSRDSPEPERPFLGGGCLLVRRDAFEEVGGFDSSLFMYGEDVDLSWKLASYGQLLLCDEAVFDHRGSDTWKAHYWRTKNRLIVEWRWARPSRAFELARFGAGKMRASHWKEGSARLVGVAAFLVARSLGRAGERGCALTPGKSQIEAPKPSPSRRIDINDPYEGRR